MPNNCVITKKDIAKLLEYLDYFQDSGSIFYTDRNGYRFESREVSSFRKELDDIGFILVFDWPTWIADNKGFRDIHTSIEDQIRDADLETLRKLMTSYIRGDRFNEGLFIQVILKGHLVSILLRLKELADAM